MGAAWSALAAALAAGAWSTPVLAQPSGGPAQVEPRLRPTPAPPSTGAPIQIQPPSQAPSAPEAEGARFLLTGVDFEGGADLPRGKLDAIAAAYVGRETSLTDLNALAGQVTAAYRAAGYILVRAVIPPQRSSSGRITVRVIEGYIDNVQILGDPGGATKLLEAYGRRIKAAKPLTRAVLERELLLASDLTGFTVRSVLTPSATTPGAADLSLVVSHRPVEGYASLDNRGSRYLGPVQAMGGVFFNDVFGTAGRLGLSGVVTPDSGPDLAYGAVSYDQPIGPDGLRAFGTVSYTGTRPGKELRALDTDGSALNGQISLSYPLVRSRDLNVLVRGGFAYRDVRSSNATLSPLFDDHVRALDVGAFVNLLDPWGGYSTLNLDLVQGLNALGATRLSSASKSRLGASGDFTRLDFEATRRQPLIDGLALQLGVSGQTSFNEPLLASEQFALGGYGYDRAYDPAEATGDAALAGWAELQWTAVRRWRAITGLQPYAFYEGGTIWQVTALPGLPPHETLVSTGVGVRLTIAGRITGDLQWARPVGPDIGLTQSRNARIFFSLTTSF